MAKDKVDPCVPANGLLTIGYGSGGHLPQTYYTREGQDLDIGFLKLFVSTQPVDYSYIAQPSPFGGVRFGTPLPPRHYEVWDSIRVPVVQAKRGYSALHM